MTLPQLGWREFGRKVLWLNLRYFPGISLEGLNKTKNSVRIACLQAKI
jgi:hypothetical protein